MRRNDAEPVVAVAVVWLSRKAVTWTYTSVSGRTPPSPTDPRTTWTAAIGWTALIATTAAVAEVVVRPLIAIEPLGDEPITELHRTRLWLNDATSQVLANGLELLGVSAPERM